jgi:tetratricopeptide (TPR) repeat protein
VVETQQGVGNKGISTFLSFGAKNVQPDILEKMLVGRQKTVNLLEQYAREIALNGVNHQVFIVGPRGAGKTHMLRVLYYRIHDLVEKKAIVVSYFAEEEYGISGYLDFLIRIINAFMRWYDSDKPALEAQLNILRETPESRQEYVAENIISDYVADKPLLILSENFDTILEALGKEGQSKLRAWLYRHNRISIIATAQATSPDLGREDRPFYGFFSTISLKKLTYEESLELLRGLAQIEENPKMIEHLAGKGQAQVRAIHELIKGNHRLLVTFYEFLKADTLAELSKIFMKTMNDLKPYYETFIRFLPAQQQKILHYLALAKIPQKGTDIAKNCFIATTSLTKQLSELQRQNLVDALPDPVDKRNKLYDVSEPLLRIAIEVGEQREGITTLFIDFLALYYSSDEIIAQKARFENMYLSESDPLKKQKHYWEMEAREQALRIQKELGIIENDLLDKIWQNLELGITYAEQENYNQAIIIFKEAILLSPSFQPSWYNLGLAYNDNKDYKQGIKALLTAINLDSDDETAWNNLGLAYIQENEYLLAIKSLKIATKINNDYQKAWKNLGLAYSKYNDNAKAIKAYQKAIKLTPEDEDAWYDLGRIYYQQEKYRQAIKTLRQCIQLNPDNEVAFYRLGMSYIQLSDYEKAESTYLQKIQMDPNSEVAWNGLGHLYTIQGNYTQAISAHEQAIKIKPTSAWAWCFLGNIYINQNNYIKSFASYKQAINIEPNFKWAWYFLGDAYNKEGNYIEAINSYQKVCEIDPQDNEIAEDLLETIINYLKDHTLTEAELIDLETWLQNRTDFDIISSYITTYRRVVFNKEEKALYELPKEQRIFFEREILKRPTE